MKDHNQLMGQNLEYRSQLETHQQFSQLVDQLSKKSDQLVGNQQLSGTLAKVLDLPD